MHLTDMLLIALLFGVFCTVLTLLDANRKIEKLNDRLQNFWEEYVGRGGGR